MMEILRGSPALSAFRINKLLARFQAARLPVNNIYAEYVHFADLNAPLNDDEHAQLERLLKYGPALASHAPQGKLLLVTPRPGTISPWSSKATDIAHNCGLQQVNRLERGVAYYIEAGTLTNEQWQQVKEVGEVPGSYDVTRAIDQAYWTVIEDGTKVKDAVTKWSKIADREIERKIEEYY